MHATFQCDISQHCWAQRVACIWPSYCNMLGGPLKKQNQTSVHVPVQHHATSKMLQEKFDHFQTWANNTQHVQHVVHDNAAICWAEMLRAFAIGRGLKVIKR